VAVCGFWEGGEREVLRVWALAGGAVGEGR